MRPILGLATTLAAALIALPAAWLLTGSRTPARVVSKHERVVVLLRTGMWYHEFDVTVQLSAPERAALPDGKRLPTDSSTRLTLRTTEAQHDALRTGMPVEVLSFSLLRRFAWLGDQSLLRATVQALGARIVAYHRPMATSVTRAPFPGLARVVEIRRIEAGGSRVPLDVIVLEFWAPRSRTLVRTADVVDARSISDIGPGQVLQMHFDTRMPRVVRLDDGTRNGLP